MKKQFFVAAMVAGMAFSCQNSDSQEQPTEQEEATEQTAKVEVEKGTNAFGVEVITASAVPVTELNTLIGKEETVKQGLTLKGKVTEVCQMKGCWMTLDQGDGTTVRVKFKDYALFMPKDIAGEEVVIHGKAMRETISADELRHYAEDAGKPEAEIAAITKDEVTLSFEADGVQILNYPQSE